MDTAFYRRQSDGYLHTEAELRIAVKPNASRHQVFLANDANNWDDGVLLMVGYDRVIATPPPANPHQLNILNGRGAVFNQGEGRWEQEWTVTPRFDTLEKLRAGMVRLVKDRMERERDRGIEVNGMRVSTTAAGLGRLMGAVQGGKSSRKFITSDGQAVELQKAQIEALRDAADNHVQAMYDNAHALIQQINASQDPATVDIDAGW